MYNKLSMPDDVRPPAIYPAGMILSCPAVACGAWVYRLRTAASFSEIVTIDGALLVAADRRFRRGRLLAR